jgi:tetratricopeptide (TPR) repeat protein
MWQIAAALLLLLTISLAAVVRRKQNPYLIVGWFWFLIMLVPVIGIVQVGLQGHADRYTYLPQIGFYIALTWLVLDLAKKWRSHAIVLAPGAIAVVTTLSILAWKQTAHWRDTESLWTYTLTVTPESDVAHTGLAGILFAQGKIDDAIAHYRRAIASRSGNSGAQHGLAAALTQQHKVDEAIEHYEKALELQPDNIEASNALALLLVHRGDYGGATRWWENTLRYEPDDGNAMSNLAWMLATCADRQLRNASRAVELAEHADRLAAGKNAIVLRTLAAAYAQDRQFDRAIATAERGVQIAVTNVQPTVADDLRRYIDMFKRGETLP